VILLFPSTSFCAIIVQSDVLPDLRPTRFDQVDGEDVEIGRGEGGSDGGGVGVGLVGEFRESKVTRQISFLHRENRGRRRERRTDALEDIVQNLLERLQTHVRNVKERRNALKRWLR
jgi:hypothetical protein